MIVVVQLSWRKQKSSYMKYILFSLLLFFLISCGSNQPIVIQQFYPFNKMTDTSYSNNHIRTYKEDYFLVSNCKDNSSTTLYIDSFVGKHINVELNNFYNLIPSFPPDPLFFQKQFRIRHSFFVIRRLCFYNPVQFV